MHGLESTLPLFSSSDALDRKVFVTQAERRSLRRRMGKQFTKCIILLRCDRCQCWTFAEFSSPPRSTFFFIGTKYLRVYETAQRDTRKL